MSKETRRSFLRVMGSGLGAIGAVGAVSYLALKHPRGAAGNVPARPATRRLSPVKNPIAAKDAHSFLVNYLSQGREAASINGLQPEFATTLANAIRRMEEDYPETRKKLRIFSGHRPVEAQALLFLDSLAHKKKIAVVRRTLAVPGCSEHQYGVAVDIVWDAAKANYFDKNPSSKLYAFMKDNASDLDLWFPMSYEPWHIEPKGSAAIRARMKEEESFQKNAKAFLGALKKTGIISADFDLVGKTPKGDIPHPLRARFEKIWLHKNLKNRDSAKRAFAKDLIAFIRQSEPGYPLFPDHDFIKQSLAPSPEKHTGLWPDGYNPARRVWLFGGTQPA